MGRGSETKHWPRAIFDVRKSYQQVSVFLGDDFTAETKCCHGTPIIFAGHDFVCISIFPHCFLCRCYLLPGALRLSAF